MKNAITKLDRTDLHGRKIRLCEEALRRRRLNHILHFLVFVFFFFPFFLSFYLFFFFSHSTTIPPVPTEAALVQGHPGLARDAAQGQSLVNLGLDQTGDEVGHRLEERGHSLDLLEGGQDQLKREVHLDQGHQGEEVDRSHQKGEVGQGL